MYTYDTVTEALAGLKSRGYTIDFNLAFDHLKCTDNKHLLYPSDFEITEHYRFEGDTDPADESAVYGISAKDGGLKGVMVTAYGAYTSEVNGDLLKKLAVHEGI